MHSGTIHRAEPLPHQRRDFCEEFLQLIGSENSNLPRFSLIPIDGSQLINEHCSVDSLI